MSTLFSPTPAAQAESSWQAVYRARLEQRQAADNVHAEIIQAYRGLAVCLRDSRERNAAWLRSSSEGGSALGPQDGAGTKSYIITLEKQLSHLRAELSDAYRSRSSSQDKQLRLTDTLRERDDEVRALKDEVRVIRERAERMSKREREYEERWKIKDNDVQHLHDEILSLHLELDQLSQRNSALQADNASLLQRWLDKMNERVDKMNADFEKESVKEPEKEISVGSKRIT